ncbi:MAG: DUF1934 domain-containing protein [Lachnospiraceae bacterium]|nr:DUF1934 domain-containing protein [Lachnospiraceae bacterium]
MTREVLISIKGLHGVREDGGTDPNETSPIKNERRCGGKNDSEEDAVEVFSAGQYYFRNGKHYVEYMEPAEVPGIEDGKKKSRITLRGKHLEILQRGSGSATTRLVFEENTKNTCWYPTPVGNVLASFDVGAVQVTESDDLIEILVDYALELNYEYVADSRIQIRIMAKDSGQFHLT